MSLKKMEESHGKTCLGEAAGSGRVLRTELFCERAGGDPAAPLCLLFGFRDVPKAQGNTAGSLKTLRCGF